MINHINTSLVQGMQAKVTQKKESGERSKSAEPDVTLQIRYAPIIAQAIQTPVADTEAVKAAQKMLARGELDSPAIIRQAAENLVDNGI